MGLANEVPGLGALLIAFSSNHIWVNRKLTHKDVCYSFLIDLKIVYPALFGKGTTLQKPSCLESYAKRMILGHKGSSQAFVCRSQCTHQISAD